MTNQRVGRPRSAVERKFPSAGEIAARPRGRPAYNPMGEPTEDLRELVRMMAAIGVPKATIAACIPTPHGLGISPQELNQRFKVELETGRAMVVAMLTSRLVKAGMAAVREAVNPETGEVEVVEVRQAGVNAAIFGVKVFGGLRTTGDRDPSDLFRVQTEEENAEVDRLESMGAEELQRAIADRLSRKG